MGRFEETPEAIQSANMRPACDRVYCQVFGIGIESIQRYEKGDERFILDKEFAIDVRITLPNGTTVTGQEKTLSNRFYKYRTFTMEFYQNRFTKEHGEFFNIASQFYLTGYSDESGTEFAEWKIIDVFRLMTWLKDYDEACLAKRTRPAGGSRASFLPIKYKDIPKDFILYHSKPKNPNAFSVDALQHMGLL